MSTIKKSEAMMRGLKDKLELRSFASNIAQSEDSQGFPILELNDGSPATGELAYVIRIRELQRTDAGVDIFQNTQTIFTPHVIELVYEDDAANRTSALTVLMKELSDIGAIIEIYENTSSNAAEAGDIDADTSGDPTETIADLIHPLSGQ